jgi:two-component system OmpR family response regulator
MEKGAMAEAPHILVVDDHREIRDALKRYLEKNGLRASVADGGAAMDAVLTTAAIDLVVLDVMMPGEDGLAICRRLRAETDLPILMLTALDEDTDRIVGLEMGADDYLTKPFNPRELLARVRAILRRVDRVERSGGTLAGRRLKFDRWTLDVDRRTLTADDGTVVGLTTAEFRLLTVFLERPRFVLSRDQLLDLTSGRAAHVFDRAIDNQVSRLRRKIERDPARPELVTTVWGGGYSFAADVAEIG